MRHLILILPILCMCACGTNYKKSPVVTPQPLACGLNEKAFITIFSPEEASLTFRSKKYALTRQEAGYGIRYKGDGVLFWNQGINALIAQDGKPETPCVYIPRPGL